VKLLNIKCYCCRHGVEIGFQIRGVNNKHETSLARHKFQGSIEPVSEQDRFLPHLSALFPTNNSTI